MSLYQPPKYKQYDRIKKLWKWVYPDPVDLNNKPGKVGNPDKMRKIKKDSDYLTSIFS